MNAYLHRSEDRGVADHGWLNSQHSFSFGQWYNPKYMGVSALRVINEDRVAAHTGFGTHPHDNMEILTCVIDGTLSHKDSMGNAGNITAGEWQLMSAGTGIRHSEMNNSDVPVHFFQIWIQPNVKNPEPNYQQIKLDPKEQPNEWHLIAGPNDNAPMHIRQNAEVKTAVLQQDKCLTVHASQTVNYIHLIHGEIQIGEYTLKTGDALVFTDAAEILALQDSQFIWFDLP